MTFKFHYHPLSSYCWKVLIALYEKGIAFEPVMVNLGDAESRAAYRKLSPMGKIPCLEDAGAGRVVNETTVQIEYLDDKFPNPPLLLPTEQSARLEVRYWDRFFDNYVMTPMNTFTVDRMRPDGQKDPAGVEDARATLQSAYTVLDAHLADKAWAAGEAFSLADCAAAPSLFYANATVRIDGTRPQLSAYFERLLARPSFARALSEAKPFFQYYPNHDLLPERFKA